MRFERDISILEIRLYRCVASRKQHNALARTPHYARRRRRRWRNVGASNVTVVMMMNPLNFPLIKNEYADRRDTDVTSIQNKSIHENALLFESLKINFA